MAIPQTLSSWLAGLPVATNFSPSDTQLIIQGGVAKRLAPLNSGRLLSMYLQVDGAHNAYATDGVFRGINQKKVGAANDFIIVRSEVFNPWPDDSMFFYTRIPDVSGFVGALNVFGEVVGDRGTVANQAGRVALSSAVVGDFCYQTDVGATFTLTSAGPGTPSNWTQNPSGTPGACTVLNPAAVEPLAGVTMCVLRLAPNLWAIQA